MNQLANCTAFPEIAEQIKEHRVALFQGLFDAEYSRQIEEWWQSIRKKLDEGKYNRHSIHVASVEDDQGGAFFHELAFHPGLVEIARACLGNDVCHFLSRLLVKDHATVLPIECRQDWPYFVGDTKKLAIMVPVTEHTEENGKLYYVANSHHYGPLTRGRIDLDRYPELPRFGPDLRVGDVFIHDFLTWHHSVPSKNRHDHAVIQIVYQPASDSSSKSPIQFRNMPVLWRSRGNGDVIGTIKTFLSSGGSSVAALFQSRCLRSWMKTTTAYPRTQMHSTTVHRANIIGQPGAKGTRGGAGRNPMVRRRRCLPQVGSTKQIIYPLIMKRATND